VCGYVLSVDGSMFRVWVFVVGVQGLEFSVTCSVFSV
jgi:hypothetical protein